MSHLPKILTGFAILLALGGGALPTARADEESLEKTLASTPPPPIDLRPVDRAPSEVTPATIILNRASFDLPEPKK